MKVKIVTGYVPIKNHPRRADEYGRLGELFRDLNAPVRAFYTKLEQCWLWRHIQQQSFQVKPCEGDNPRKNSLAYHCVNHQKPEWLAAAAKEDSEADTFVWMDYGIAHQLGVLPEVVNAFIPRIAKGDFAIPGCWDANSEISMDYPNWRFCGSLLIVPREHIEGLRREMASVVIRKIENKRCVDWEVNSLARVERLKRLPIRWYEGNHDASQLTNYRAPGESSFSAGLRPVGEHGPRTEGLVSKPEAA